MQVTLTKSMYIEASHQLKHHDGKCGRVHGHSWLIEVDVLSDVNPTTNMGLDYYHMSSFLDGVSSKLDHQHLNDVLETDDPTSEFLANIIFDWAVLHFERNSLYMAGARVAAVRVRETQKSCCTFTREQWKNVQHELHPLAKRDG